eukprot:g25835.t1
MDEIFFPPFDFKMGSASSVTCSYFDWEDTMCAEEAYEKYQTLVAECGGGLECQLKYGKMLSEISSRERLHGLRNHTDSVTICKHC